MKTHYDVIVAGGGIAGIAAALAAARSGADVLLLEKQYALGGQATLGLVIIYLPIDDGLGEKMSASISEELLRCALPFGPGKVPDAWADPLATSETRKGIRYELSYNAASMMIAAERLLVEAGVHILYDVRLSAVTTEGDLVTAISIETKLGRTELTASACIDYTGDADLCYFAGEKTVEDTENRGGGWYFSYNGVDRPALRTGSDRFRRQMPRIESLYSGTDPEAVSQHMIEMRRMIWDHTLLLREHEHPDSHPLLIPTYHNLLMTRRLETSVHFSEAEHDFAWFRDAIGMIGSWKEAGHRYSIPYRAIKAESFRNLYAAGRCCCAEKSGWDLTRVIPTCAVTGEAAGLAAAWQAQHDGAAPHFETVQTLVTDRGGLLRPELFDRVLDV